MAKKKMRKNAAALLKEGIDSAFLIVKRGVWLNLKQRTRSTKKLSLFIDCWFTIS